MAEKPKRRQGARLDKKVITLDLKNALGETFHFENQPGEKDDLPTRPSSGPTGDTIVDLIMPI